MWTYSESPGLSSGILHVTFHSPTSIFFSPRPSLPLPIFSLHCDNTFIERLMTGLFFIKGLDILPF